MAEWVSLGLFHPEISGVIWDPTYNWARGPTLYWTFGGIWYEWSGSTLSHGFVLCWGDLLRSLPSPKRSQRVYPWKWMVGIRLFPFWIRPIFRCDVMLVSWNVPRGFITIKLTTSWENICFRKFFQASNKQIQDDDWCVFCCIKFFRECTDWISYYVTLGIAVLMERFNIFIGPKNDCSLNEMRQDDQGPTRWANFIATDFRLKQKSLSKRWWIGE